MSFISLSFVAFFVCVLLLYYAVNSKYQKSILLLASCFFIGYYHISFLLTALVISFMTFYFGKLIASTQQDKKIRWLYFSSVSLLIIVWLILRHPEGMESVVNRVFPLIDLPWRVSQHSVLFPLGISFYTFQAISYLTEIYWGEEEPENNVFDFLLYMLFFMKFLSGPIERPSGLLHQLKEKKEFNYDMVTFGLKLMFIGLMKKVVLADNMAPYLDGMYGSLHDASGMQLVMTCLLYPIQLYADFSGYTDIALGGAAMFGFNLTPNFDRPFISKTTAELWRRWHMSLSFWVRDYVYIPLTSETRGWGRWGISFSLLVTFISLGIWHGAGWNYAMYGLIQGVIITYEMQTANFHAKLADKLGKSLYNGLSIVRTYLLFALSLIFFRAESFHDAIYFLTHMSFSINHSWKELNIGMSDHNCVVAGITLVLMLVYEHYNSKQNIIELVSKKNTAVRWIIYYVLAFALFTMGGFNTDTFVYLQF